MRDRPGSPGEVPRGRDGSRGTPLPASSLSLAAPRASPPAWLPFAPDGSLALARSPSQATAPPPATVMVLLVPHAHARTNADVTLRVRATHTQSRTFSHPQNDARSV